VHVAVEIGPLAVQTLAHLVGQLAELEQVGMLKKRDTVLEAERLAGLHLVFDLPRRTWDSRASLHKQNLAGRRARATPRPTKTDYFCLLLDDQRLRPCPREVMVRHRDAPPARNRSPSHELQATSCRGAGQPAPASVPRTRHVADDHTPLYTNRLALESSPYLLQHAHNPVNWYPWGDEAFAEARRLGRPVFLSIGYSTCHWCHVMEEESFEDETIAGFLNAHYVAIKVDREERPDVDAVYMRAAQQLGGSGGWPLSVWLTAEREPFFVGTYFPTLRGQARCRAWVHRHPDRTCAPVSTSDPKRVHEAAQALAGRARRHGRDWAGADSDGLERTSARCRAHRRRVEQCARAFDDENGGLRVGQKFPSHVPIRLLLRHHQRTGDATPCTWRCSTLEAMAAGGIYDHVAGGFHRYATDPQWLVPHFEKMLYDNALLVVAYAEAWQVTKRPTFARVVRETCDELLATFASPEGGFYSATDADSEGEEGKYFVWGEEEIRAVLGAGEDTELFLRHYGVTRHGNFEAATSCTKPSPTRESRRRLGPGPGQAGRGAQAPRASTSRREDPRGLERACHQRLCRGGRVLGETATSMPPPRGGFLCSRMRDTKTGRLARSFCDGRWESRDFWTTTHSPPRDCSISSKAPASRAGSTKPAACRGNRGPVRRSRARWLVHDQPRARAIAGRERPALRRRRARGQLGRADELARLAAFTDDERWRDAIARSLAFYLPRMQANSPWP
jgi:hypothetical protein